MNWAFHSAKKVNKAEELNYLSTNTAFQLKQSIFSSTLTIH